MPPAKPPTQAKPPPSLARTLQPCPTCGAVVCVRVWVMAEGQRTGKWAELPVPVSPVLGEDHVCPAGRESKGDDAASVRHVKLSSTEPIEVSVQSVRAKDLVPSAPAGHSEGEGRWPPDVERVEDHQTISR
jgi:hypothetical protein